MPCTNATFLATADGSRLAIYDWLPEIRPKAVVQIVHGLAEHAGRYAAFAAALNEAGYAVYADDHRGHGRTALAPEGLGFFAASDGWRKCLDDLGLLHRHIANRHPGTSIVLLGHSMGSIMAQHVMSEQGGALAGVILSASNGRPSLPAAAGRWVARLERARLGPRGRSALLNALAFGAFNRSFEPARTPFDWLSRDPVAVDEYRADPLCGFRSTTQLWIDLLDALGEVVQPAKWDRIPKRLPIHFIAGECDPVGKNTGAIERLINDYRRAGLEEVTYRFYPGARHELLHETNRVEVTRDLIAWLDNAVAPPIPRSSRPDP
jgi:alpha-beta hydrolase superfamily lysophospholipase